MPMKAYIAFITVIIGLVLFAWITRQMIGVLGIMRERTALEVRSLSPYDSFETARVLREYRKQFGKDELYLVAEIGNRSGGRRFLWGIFGCFVCWAGGP